MKTKQEFHAVVALMAALSGPVQSDEVLTMFADHQEGRITLMDVACQEAPADQGKWMLGIMVPNGGVYGRDYELVCWKHAPDDGVTIYQSDPERFNSLPKSSIRYEFFDY